MNQQKKNYIYFLAVLAGMTLRGFASTRGFNFDTRAVFTISDLPWNQNFYHAVPQLANLGPVPYWFFELIRTLPDADSIATFHHYQSVLFSLCDFVTSFVLFRTWGLRSAVLFLVLSPAAIVLSGFHCNVEPMVVAIVLTGYALQQKFRPNESEFPKILCVAIGLSLASKHIFAFFPLWLVMRPQSMKNRLKILSLCYGTWLALVIAYMIPNPTYFVKNVLMYSSWSGNALLPELLSATAKLIGIELQGKRLIWFVLFLTTQLGLAWHFRKISIEKKLIIYPVVLLVTTSAVALQYFATPSFAIAANFNWISLLYNAVALYLFGGHAEELNLWPTAPLVKNITDSSQVYPANVLWLVLQAIMLLYLINFVRKERSESTPS